MRLAPQVTRVGSSRRIRRRRIESWRALCGNRASACHAGRHVGLGLRGVLGSSTDVRSAVRSRLLLTPLAGVSRHEDDFLQLGRFGSGRCCSPPPASAAELKPGDPAPDFSLVGTDGKTYKLSDFKGKSAVVVAWFPKAKTGGCTIECKNIKAEGDKIRGLQRRLLHRQRRRRRATTRNSPTNSASTIRF